VMRRAPAPPAVPAPVLLAAADPAPFASPPVVEAPKAQPKRVAAKAPAPNPALSPRAASFTDSRPVARKASFPKVARVKRTSVVQLGAYTDREFVGVAWTNFAKKYPALRGYTPATARFDSSKGLVFRLSVQGFASDGDARN